MQFGLEIPALPEAQQELEQLKRDLSTPLVLEVWPLGRSDVCSCVR